MLENGAKWTSRSSEAVVNTGNFDFLKWTVDEKKCKWGKTSALGIAATGNLDVLKWAHSAGCIVKSSRVATFAAASGNLEMLQWLVTKKSKLTPDAWLAAIVMGHSHIVPWIESQIKIPKRLKAPCTTHNSIEELLTEVFQGTIKLMKMPVTRYASRISVPIWSFYAGKKPQEVSLDLLPLRRYTEAVNVASVSGNLTGLKMLVKNHFQIPLNTRAAAQGNSDIVEYLLQKNSGLIGSGWQNAAAEGHLKLFTKFGLIFLFVKN